MQNNDTPKLPTQILERLYTHARQEFPRECCGYLRQNPRGVWRIYPCENAQDQRHALDPLAHPRDAHHAFAIDGAELLALVRSLASDSPARMIYHSHPRVGAYFSHEDQKNALASGYNLDHLVIDVQNDGVVESRCYRRHGEGPTFVEIARFPGDDAFLRA